MTDRVTLITGASSGIGAELARIFAAKGHRVALVARRADKLAELAGSIVAAGGVQPAVIVCDLQKPDAGNLIVSQLQAQNLDVEILVNNAGFGLFGLSADLDRERQLAMIDLNVRALTDLSLRFSENVVRNKGGILNVSSIAAFLPGPGMAVYYASKAFVLSFTEALRGELGRHGVKVTALCPGPVPTEFQQRAGFAPGLDSAVLNVPARDVAAAGYRGLMKNRQVVLPGLGIRLIPFFLRFAPRNLVLAAVSRVQRSR
ncbi:MAG TPA: SDR family oxidoreductase [Afipia sp.]